VQTKLSNKDEVAKIAEEVKMMILGESDIFG
jgi:hypothetical protein